MKSRQWSFVVSVVSINDDSDNDNDVDGVWLLVCGQCILFHWF